MPTIYTNPPIELTSGDSYIWRESPENGSEVTAYSFIFRSFTDSDSEFTVTGIDEGETFLFVMDGTESSAFDGGSYSVTELVTRGADGRTTGNCKTLQLFDNPANDPTKTYNQRILEALQSHLEGRMPEGLERHEVGGLPIEKIPIAEVSALVDRYQKKVNNENNQRRIARDPNAASGNTVYVGF